MKHRDQKFLRKLDMFLLILFPIISVVSSLLLKANFLISIFLFLGLPSIYFSFRTPEQIKKTLAFALIVTVPFGILFDYIATVGKAWFITSTVFPFRLFGVIPIEDFIFGFFLVYSIIIFYEHFLDKGKHELVDKRMKYLLWPLIIFLLIFFIVIFTRPDLLVIPYAHFWTGIVFIFLPAITFLSFFPRLLSKYVKIGSYFFILSLLFELTALQLHQWSFPASKYIGWVSLFGQRFPFEELFFWLVLFSIGILSYYEFFDDDRK